MELDSELTARLTEACVQSVLTCLNTFKGKTAVPLKLFQGLLWHMAAAAAVTPLGLLHMRPLQLAPRPSSEEGVAQRPSHHYPIAPSLPWSDPLFLRAGVPLNVIVCTDASTMGWGTTYNGCAVSGVWTAPQLHWHIKCLELCAVYLAFDRPSTSFKGRAFSRAVRPGE